MKVGWARTTKEPAFGKGWDAKNSTYILFRR